MKPKRIQRRRTRGWKMPPNAVYVGRPTIWGNPFRVGAVYLGMIGDAFTANSKSDCVRLYRRYAVGEFSVEGKAFNSESLSQLRGKDLACWCPLDKPCHADILLELANA